MGHIFKDEWLENIIVGITFGLFMAKEIGKAVGKCKEAIIGIIYEIKGKYEKRKVKGHIFA